MIDRILSVLSRDRVETYSVEKLSPLNCTIEGIVPSLVQ